MEYKFPKGIGACADKMYKLREDRLAKQKIVDAIEAEEKALKAHIIDELPKSKASGVAGKVARVTVVKKEIPTVTDRDAFQQYMVDNNRFDLANKLQPSRAGIVEMWDDGEDIPGVGKYTAVTVSLTKA